MSFHLLPTSGRLIGLYPEGSAENFLWTNPGPSGAWPNPGGDRTWLAPEIDLFISDLNRIGETYAVPAALDPGRWEQAGPNRLVNSTRLHLHRSERDVDVRLEKEYLPAPNPLPGTRLQYAGYTQVTRLETGAPLGIWNLLQLPAPGVMLVATRGVAQPQTVFGEIAEAGLVSGPGLLRWRMDGGGDAKISLLAADFTGRAAHLHQRGPDSWDLVVRDVVVAPAGQYVDALWAPPHTTGWAFQACRVRSLGGGFNELEYHAPVATREDESRVWAFRGPLERITEAAELLLGTRV
jgi:hypothetical protein